ncbi:MAG: hypothetical protein U9P82_10430 [Bacteroidota bacterium]|nr:hypothetical protein [Bacteroidota bacterium]
MEEKDRKLEERNNLINTKLTWETPKLYALDKGRTENGEFPGEVEDTVQDFYS